MEYYVSAPFDLSKVAGARSVTEQYKAEFGSDPRIHSLRSHAAVQVFAKALEKSGTSDSSAVIDTWKEVEILVLPLVNSAPMNLETFWGLAMHSTKSVQLQLVRG